MHFGKRLRSDGLEKHARSVLVHRTVALWCLVMLNVQGSTANDVTWRLAKLFDVADDATNAADDAADVANDI